MFTCGLCGREVAICTSCDRGNRYCGEKCASTARQGSLHQARQKFVKTPRGRLSNARRQKRFRSRRQTTEKGNVTDQGSQTLARERQRATQASSGESTTPVTAAMLKPVVEMRGNELGRETEKADGGTRGEAKASRRPGTRGIADEASFRTCNLCGRRLVGQARRDFLAPVERRYRCGPRPRRWWLAPEESKAPR